MQRFIHLIQSQHPILTIKYMYKSSICESSCGPDIQIWAPQTCKQQKNSHEKHIFSGVASYLRFFKLSKTLIVRTTIWLMYRFVTFLGLFSKKYLVSSFVSFHCKHLFESNLLKERHTFLLERHMASF